MTFSGLLALLFIGLKLGHVIAWPWVWVLAPLWIPLLLVALYLLVVSIGLTVALTYKGKDGSK